MCTAYTTRRSRLKSRRSSDIRLQYAALCGIVLVSVVVCFLVLVVLDASIAGRVIDFLFQYVSSHEQASGKGVYGNYR